MSNLTDYLLELAADPERCARFKLNPEAELRESNLTEREKAAIATRDPKIISQAMADQTSDSGIIMQWLLSVFNEAGGYGQG